MEVPVGFLCDGSTMSPDVGVSWLIHDYLYSTHKFADGGECQRVDADHIMMNILMTAGREQILTDRILKDFFPSMGAAVSALTIEVATPEAPKTKLEPEVKSPVLYELACFDAKFLTPPPAPEAIFQSAPSKEYMVSVSLSYCVAPCSATEGVNTISHSNLLKL